MEKIIGKRIQEFRKKKGMTQDELSEIIDISPHYLSALERGIYNIKLETLNIMGFIGVGNTQLQIRSRFETGQKDFFLYLVGN